MDIEEAYQTLLQAQDELPEIQKHLTIREMGEKLGIASTSHVSFVIDRLVKAGMAEKIELPGKKSIYRIKPGYIYKHNKARHD